MRNRNLLWLLVATWSMLVFPTSKAQLPFSERLPKNLLDVDAPSTRVVGTPGDMIFSARNCRAPLPTTEIRSHIVNTAVQEWAYFGYSIQDLTNTRESDPNYLPQRRPRSVIDPVEVARVADSIAGYWSTTPDSAWILERQNQSWNSRGSSSRWRNPWSAAFISWVMCESGLGDPRVFRRAIAHHSYIDQAITARDDDESLVAYIAHDPGELPIVPGDLLCRGSRPNYQSINARRQQLGEGARTHCDIVVKLDNDNRRIMLIGGNVSGWVRLKLLPAEINTDGLLAPTPYNGRRIFAHLKLQATLASGHTLEQSPTVQSILCNKNYAGLLSITNTFSIDCSKSTSAD
ncbi:MAG: DUF2272 domain-containing protein [Proteobacteria bacterium]|nr:DUF2272 domain-containing protein [Pseudomonadota bacterium]